MASGGAFLLRFVVPLTMFVIALGEARALPAQENTTPLIVVVTIPTAQQTTTYSPMADVGSLAQGAAGFVGQVWNTGTRFGGELTRRIFGSLAVRK
ncbi:uncharacterized protein LOC128268285 [Anopheles cruzii]|uniref:uncharacterized protein LOC128268285 n=1 Tax=Anopheles cruzii TaxID=68878 RepID=UPI0022EC470B|nr:uncharacterized protein LOC128268285 [Anopheles cruzii]